MGEELPFPDASFDLAFGRRFSIIWMSIRRSAELLRVLKPGGKALLSNRSA
ncbi:MAG: methyltransferase domain-containing protein [Chloroflexi bacterium]|uniref:class I SAM-dependent methyltransferase n=1 Tax=Candidatus Flexifilum breve TaxID=3140694 RepID=UPI0031357102|nr:methyltransferase domain-containing protein [Chloroflexota bacterium]